MQPARPSPGQPETLAMVEIPWSIILRKRTWRVAEDFYALQGTANGTALAFVPMFTGYDLALRFLASLGDEGQDFCAYRPKLPADFEALTVKLRKAGIEFVAFDYEQDRPTKIATIGRLIGAVRNREA